MPIWEKNGNLLIAASLFWSDVLNAFLFGNGPMTPMLLDVIMLTGLNISKNDRPFDTITKPIHWLVTKGAGGWKGYIIKHTRIGTINNREHTAFLNIWLKNSSSMDQLVGPPLICNQWPKDSFLAR
jgi:hypothetical protein